MIELRGTEYVIASLDNRGEISSAYPSLLFINTNNGMSKQLDFPEDSYLQNIRQIKIDSLKINKVLIVSKPFKLNRHKNITWLDTAQLFVCSSNGMDLKQVTDSTYFLRTWAISKRSFIE